MADKSILDSITNQSIRLFINFLSWIAFILANAVIFISVKPFYTIDLSPLTPTLSLWTYFLIGLLLSITLLKTDKILLIHKQNKKPFDKKELEAITEHTNIGIMNGSIIIFRLLFFNFANQVFTVLIVWVAYLGLTNYLDIAILTNTDNFMMFASTVGAIGVLSGVFQFYLSNHKENVSNKVSQILAKQLLNLMKSINYNDFLKFIEQENTKLHQKVKNPIESKSPLIKKYWLRERGNNTINFLQVNVNPMDDIQTASIVEDELQPTPRKELTRAYKEYFKNKNKSIEKELKKLDLTDIQRLILPNILLFDEDATVKLVIQDLTERPNSEPETYEEFYYEAQRIHVEYLMKQIINTKNKN